MSLFCPWDVFVHMPAVVSKRGVDDGNQKGGGSPQPAQENQTYHFITKIDRYDEWW